MKFRLWSTLNTTTLLITTIAWGSTAYAAQTIQPKAMPVVQWADPQINPQSQCVPNGGTANGSTPAATVSVVPPATLAADAKPIRVVTTVAPLTNIAFNIGGVRIQLHGLIPEGVDSHTFEPKPSDAKYLAAADIVFVNGLHLEDPTLALAANTMRPNALLIQLSSYAVSENDWIFDFSFPKDRGDPNPHLWMNPFYALRYAQVFRDTFIAADPSHAAYYAANYAVFEARIHTLDRGICDAIASIPATSRKLLTYHDSFAYFAPRYGIAVIGAIQPSDFSEPSAADVARLIEQLKQEKVPAIFGSEVFPSTVLTQIGQEAGVSYINTLADDDLPNQQDNRLYHSYLQLMVNDASTMATALGGSDISLKAVDTSNIPGSDVGIDADWSG